MIPLQIYWDYNYTMPMRLTKPTTVALARALVDPNDADLSGACAGPDGEFGVATVSLSCTLAKLVATLFCPCGKKLVES